MKLRHAELMTPANPRLLGKSAGVIGVVSSALLGVMVNLRFSFIYVLTSLLRRPFAAKTRSNKSPQSHWNSKTNNKTNQPINRAKRYYELANNKAAQNIKRNEYDINCGHTNRFRFSWILNDT